MGKYLFLLSESELARTTDNATPIKEEIKTEYDISIILVGQSWLGLPIMQYLNYFTLLNEPNTSQYRLNMTYMVQKHIKKCIL